MKQNTLFIFIASLVLVAGLVLAGCMQGSGTDNSAAAGAPAQGSGDVTAAPANPSDSTAGNGYAAATDNGGQNSGSSTGTNPGTDTGRPNRGIGGQGGFMNETRISAAAVKLGISEDTLKTALNSTTNSTTGRPDFTAAAQQLGITQQQLTDAFGFPAGGFGNGTHTRGNWTGMRGQGYGGQQPQQGQGQSQ